MRRKTDKFFSLRSLRNIKYKQNKDIIFAFLALNLKNMIFSLTYIMTNILLELTNCSFQQPPTLCHGGQALKGAVTLCK